jgi:hypothetical protein
VLGRPEIPTVLRKGPPRAAKASERADVKPHTRLSSVARLKDTPMEGREEEKAHGGRPEGDPRSRTLIFRKGCPQGRNDEAEGRHSEPEAEGGDAAVLALEGGEFLFTKCPAALVGALELATSFHATRDKHT